MTATTRLATTYAQLQSAVSASIPGDIVECAAGNYHLAAGANVTDDWADLTNNNGLTGANGAFVWGETLAAWVNPIIIRPATGASGQVYFGCLRKNGQWPVIFDGINFKDDNTPALTGQNWNSSWALIFDNGGVNQIGIRNCTFSGLASSTDGVGAPVGMRGTNGVVIEDSTFYKTSECVLNEKKCRLSRLTYFEPWKQVCQIGQPDGLVYEDITAHKLHLSTGAHGDLLHIVLPNKSGVVTTYTVSSIARLTYWQEGASATQGIWVEDQAGGTSSIDFGGSSIKNVSYLGVAQSGIDLSRSKNVIIECNTLLCDQFSIASAQKPGIRLFACDNVTIRNNAVNEIFVDPSCTNMTYSGSANVVLNRNAAADADQLGAFPNLTYGATLTSKALFNSATTPAVSGLARLVSDVFCGTLKPGPGGVGYVLNDGLPFSSTITTPPALPSFYRTAFTRRAGRMFR